MEILLDSDENICFQSLLYSTLKNYFNETLQLSDCSAQAANTLDYYENQFYMKLGKNQKTSKKRIMTGKRQFFNPCFDYFNLLMFFLAWKKFGTTKKNRVGKMKKKGNISDFKIEE